MKRFTPRVGASHSPAHCALVSDESFCGRLANRSDRTGLKGTLVRGRHPRSVAGGRCGSCGRSGTAQAYRRAIIGRLASRQSWWCETSSDRPPLRYKSRDLSQLTPPSRTSV